MCHRSTPRVVTAGTSGKAHTASSPSGAVGHLLRAAWVRGGATPACDVMGPVRDEEVEHPDHAREAARRAVGSAEAVHRLRLGRRGPGPPARAGAGRHPVRPLDGGRPTPRPGRPGAERTRIGQRKPKARIDACFVMILIAE